MTRPLGEDIEALVAGELSPDEADRVLAKIATDPDAAIELDEALQMRAMGHELGASEGQLARRRRTRTIIGFAALAVAAAAALVLYLGRREPTHDDLADRVFASLAPHRQLEPRLSWPAADRYRPYDPPRASTTKPETLSFELLAEVEKAGDPRALPAAQLLTGNLDGATAALDKATETADTLADRSAIALVHHDAERALVAAAAALDKAPAHPQARWNRALALQALGLDRTAAAAFDDIAAAHEPGWSDEATAQAAALHAQRKRRDDAWTHAQELGNAMVAGGPVPLDQVAAFPGLMRLYFYDAMRTAGSAARVTELLPLADALDTAFGGTTLHDYATRIVAAPQDKRAPLAARFAKIAATGGDDVKPLIRDARSAHQDDILLGALYWGGPGGEVDPVDLDELGKLTKATHDDWLALYLVEQTASVEIVRGDASAAETSLRAAAPTCERGPLVYRCMKLWRALVEIYQGMHRPAAAAEALAHARRDAIASGSVIQQDDLLVYASWQATIDDDTTFVKEPLAAQYLDEAERSTLPCSRTQVARDAVVQTLSGQKRNDDARVINGGGRHCDAPLTVRHALTLAQVVDERDVPALRDKLAELRKTELSAGEHAFVDYIEGSLAPFVPEPERRVLLRHAIDTPGTDPANVLARAYSYGTLIDDAAARHAWRDVLGLLAEERGVPLPPSCVMAAAESTGTVFAIRRPDGSVDGVYLRRANGEALGGHAIPDDLIRAIATCGAVDVLARAPYFGRAGLLPASLAWRFRAGSTVAAGPTKPVVVVANVAAPDELHLAALNPVEPPANATIVEGHDATPSRVLAAIRTAGYVEIHSHGLGDAADDAAMLVLSPDANGSYALTAEEIAKSKLVAHPIVVLAACGAAATGRTYLGSHGLADAFIRAGARAVIASPEPIADAAAPKLFASLRDRIAAGATPERALADERASWRDPAQRAWIDRLVVFQ